MWNKGGGKIFSSSSLATHVFSEIQRNIAYFLNFTNHTSSVSFSFEWTSQHESFRFYCIWGISSSLKRPTIFFSLPETAVLAVATDRKDAEEHHHGTINYLFVPSQSSICIVVTSDAASCTQPNRPQNPVSDWQRMCPRNKRFSSRLRIIMKDGSAILSLER